MTIPVRMISDTVVEIMVVPEGFSLEETYPAADLENVRLAPENVAVGWVTKDDGKTFSAPMIEPSPVAPAVRSATGFNLIGALSKDQVSALLDAKTKDQLALSAGGSMAFTESDDLIVRVSKLISTEPKAWFDLATSA